MRKIVFFFIPLFVILSVVCSCAEANLIAYYDFEGNANDSSGNGYNGTINGATLTAGYSGQAYDFNGAGNYIQAPVNINPGVLPQVTMGAWVKADSSSPVRQVISQDNGGFDRSLGIDSRGGLTGWSAFTGSGVLGSSTVAIGEWTFLAVSYDQTNTIVKLYVNGNEWTHYAYNYSGWPYVRIGSNPSYGEYFDGVIDEVFIYDEYLNKEQLDEIRNNREVIPEPASLFLLGSGLAGVFLRKRKIA